MRTLKQVLLMLIVVLAGLWLASASAVIIMEIAQWHGGAGAEWLAEKGWPAVMRRSAMFWAAVFLFICFKRAGWRGWEDSGFTTQDPLWARRPRWLLTTQGIALGLLTFGPLAALSLYFGVRTFSPLESQIKLANTVIGIVMSGIVISLIEETVCRGILFRLATRVWKEWMAALLISVLFALAHFIRPAAESFQKDGFLSTSTAVFVSSLVTLPSSPIFWLRMLNLTLLGIVLAAMMIRTKTIWFGIGAHAAWVWAIRFNMLLTEQNWISPLYPYFGRRGDFTDALAAIFVLIITAGCIIFWRAPDGIIIRKKGLRWHVKPDMISVFKEWIERHFHAIPPRGQNTDAQKESSSACRLLKEYEGCRILALAGWVVKEQWPKRGWKGIRFAFMPSRARRGFVLARKLASRGIPTPEAIAWSIKRRFIFARASYAVTRELKHSQPLTDWLIANPHDHDLPKIMASYGRLMAIFHSNRYSNRDFKHENVMCSLSSPAALQVVDLDGVSRKWLLTRSRAQKDLRRVGCSLKDIIELDKSNIRDFFDEYNARVPSRLRMNDFPI